MVNRAGADNRRAGSLRSRSHPVREPGLGRAGRDRPGVAPTSPLARPRGTRLPAIADHPPRPPTPCAPRVAHATTCHRPSPCQPPPILVSCGKNCLVRQNAWPPEGGHAPPYHGRTSNRAAPHQRGFYASDRLAESYCAPGVLGLHRWQHWTADAGVRAQGPRGSGMAPRTPLVRLRVPLLCSRSGRNPLTFLSNRDPDTPGRAMLGWGGSHLNYTVQGKPAGYGTSGGSSPRRRGISRAGFFSV